MTNSRATAISMSPLLSAAVTLLALSQSGFVDAMRIPVRDPSSFLLSARDTPIKRSPRVILCTGTMRIDENTIQCQAGLYPSADDPNAITCTSTGSVTCKSGIAPQDGYCLTAWDCNGAPPRYLAPDNVSCYPCPGQNATSCDRNGGSTAGSYGVPENGACVAVRCPTSSVNTDGNGCCPDPYATTCNSSGSLTCKYFPLADGKCPGPVDCSPAPPRYPYKDRLSCLNCPANATSCDDQGNAMACSYGIVADGKCKQKKCSNDRVNAKGNACCPKFTLTCEDTNTALTCEKGYKINGELNSTTPCQGPYASRYGRGTYRYAAVDVTTYRDMIPSINIEECARRAQQIDFTAWKWSPYRPGQDYQCTLLADFGQPLVGLPLSYLPGSDFGTFGTCDDTTKNWAPSGPEHAQECEDLFLG